MGNNNAPYADYWLASNLQAHYGCSIIVKTTKPMAFIRFTDELVMFSDFYQFYAHAKVEWIDPTSEGERAQILADAYDFLCIEERLIDGDIDQDVLDF